MQHSLSAVYNMVMVLTNILSFDNEFQFENSVYLEHFGQEFSLTVQVL